MARRTAVIDIGSNSARLVIFQQTSRYGFHLLCQHKSRVRIGEGAYQRGGYLQELPMRRALETLRSFQQILQAYRVDQTFCVATSALRDAPNRSEFIDRVQREVGITIRVIDGKEEARFGATAAANLLPVSDAITVDIGGGSADMALIHDGKIVEAFSLDLGTVRIKELFTEETIQMKKARKYIRNELKRLPKSFAASTVIGIGGSARALAKGIMRQTQYPLDKLHAFTYEIEQHRDYMEAIIDAPISHLDRLSIDPARYDTIREGVLILLMILERVQAKFVMTSGVGVREGVYLQDLLHDDDGRYPKAINPSVQSIRDRLDLLDLPSGNKRLMAQKLFALYGEELMGLEDEKTMLLYALDLSNIGKMLTIYKEHQHAFYVAKHELNFGFTHQQMILIAMLLRSKGKKYHKELYRAYKTLLPKKRQLKWLVFFYSLVLIFDENAPGEPIEFSRSGHQLNMTGTFAKYLIQEQISALPLPGEIHVVLE